MDTRVITITLTPEQSAALLDLYDTNIVESDQGRPGMIIGQFLSGQARVRFLDNSQAKALQQALGGKVGQMTSMRPPGPEPEDQGD